MYVCMYVFLFLKAIFWIVGKVKWHFFFLFFIEKHGKNHDFPDNLIYKKWLPNSIKIEHITLEEKEK